MRAVSLLIALFLVSPGFAAGPKGHVIAFGKPMPVKWFIGPTEDKVVDMKVRPLFVDGHIKEFTTGDAHDVTDRILVVRKVHRINDLLPQEPRTPPKWMWQRDGWVMVNRDSGRVSPIKLPEFDPFYSAASWYRDYVAYCGVDAEAGKLYAVVAQLGSKRPLVRKELGASHDRPEPDSECPPPAWQRQPTRVTFEPQGGQKLTFEVHGVSATAIESEPDEASQ